MQPEGQSSISSAVFGLQESLKGLQQKWTCLQKPTDDATTSKQPNELHALGSINLDKAKEEFSKQISIIRNVCSQFETEVLGDVMKMGVGADPAFRKHFTHLKEQAALESTVMRVKDTLKNTKEFLEKSLQEKEESKSKIETQRLEKLAQSMGLVTFVDSSQKLESGIPITTITLGGTVIVVDIDIDDTGKVQRTKVTYVSETLQNDQDDRVDKMLAANLQARDFNLFTRNLESLALLDRLNVKYTPVDFFSITKSLLKDLKAICNQEFAIVSNLETVLLDGHGIPSLHLDYPGISIAYWMDKKVINGANWEEIQQSFENNENNPALSNTSKLLLSFEDSIQPMCYLPPSRSAYLLDFHENEETIREGTDGEHFKVVVETSAPTFSTKTQFVKPLPTNPNTNSIPIRFVLTLDPPMAVADEVSQKLLNVTGLVDTSTLPTANAATTKSSNFTHTQSLEEMLVMSVKEDALHSDHSWVYSSDDMPNQIYKWMGSSPTSAKIVSRIPFQHPVQIYNILQCLRQQKMFNTLFQSVFNSDTFKKEASTIPNTVSFSLSDILSESKKDDAVRIEIATIDAPYFISVTISPPALPNQPFVMIPLSIEIPMENPTKPVIRLHSSSAAKSHRWNPKVFDEAKMSEAIQQMHDIPSFISWLYKRMVDTDSYLIERGGYKRSRTENEIDENNKSMKMEIDDE